MTGPFTVDQLDALDRQVQMAQDQRLAVHLAVTGARVPVASPAPEWPGVPEGAEFAPVAANPEVAGAVTALGWRAAS